ncbi:MAG: SGNH/GDSL hydrolase family protein [Clostridia bacterium]|nr:SGNH/GDSL hydrolase family protein [Clostridia bacterium]
MKKTLIFLLISMLLLSFCACDGFNYDILDSDSSDSGNGSDAPTINGNVSDVSVRVPSGSFKAVVLGDSIARGYGLESPESMRFSALLEKSLAMVYEDIEIANYGVDGRTGEELIDFVKNEPPKELADCDCIIISIGGNNILQMLDTLDTALNALMEIDPKAVADYFKYTVTDEGEEKDKLAYACDVLSSVFGAINVAFESETFNSLITDAGKRLENEIPRLISELRKINPDAKIYFQTVYNPYKDINLSLQDVEEKLDLDTHGERAVAKLNAPIEALAEENGYEIVPVWQEFDRSNKTLTNAGISLITASISFDPHPNARGHKLIAEIYYGIISEAKND